MGVALIATKRLVGKTKESFCHCHPLKLVTSFKQVLSSPRLRGPKMRLRRVHSSSHLSFQKDRWLSLPTTHLDPLLSTASPFLIADQILEQDCGLKWAFVTFLATLYLWFRTLAHKAFVSIFNRQLSLAKRAVFFALAACKLRPPSLLDLAIFFQLTKWSFFLLSVDPYRKSRLSLSTLWSTLEGRATHCIA